MAGLQIEYLKKLDPARRQAILSRSRVDVSAVLATVAPIIAALRRDGDAESIRQHRQFKADLAVADLEATPEEIEAAYRAVDPRVLSGPEGGRGQYREVPPGPAGTGDVGHGSAARHPGRTPDPLPGPGGLLHPRRPGLLPFQRPDDHHPGQGGRGERDLRRHPAGAGDGREPRHPGGGPPGRGASRLFKIGGPWAIGSLAYGTELVPQVDKIVGPGNKYVTAAKLLVFGEVDIDSPAGPSEALILADETAEPRFLAMDFLSQVEHDPEAAAVLVTPSAELAQKVVDLIVSELPHLPRREIMEAALGKYSAALVVEDLDEAIDFANQYAAEHLQIVTQEPFAILPRIRHAGSIFLGPYAPVPVGDYASGTNHVLPTGGCARMFSGLSVDDFIKKPTFQHLSREALAASRTR